MPATHVPSWIHYEQLLEKTVLEYRAVNSSISREGTMGEAFMNTHSFAEEQLTGVYKTLVHGYATKNETLQLTCENEVILFFIISRLWGYF